VLLFSAAIATLATGINVVGHWGNVYAAVFFGALSASAYILYLFHSAFRRRDALRARKALAKPAPIYGWRQWRREPEVTRRARSLAQANNLGLHESLRMARDELRAETRLVALAKLVERRIRQEHSDATSAAIAANTYDLARLAAEIEARADYAGWADVIGETLSPRNHIGGGSWRDTTNNQIGDNTWPQGAARLAIPGRRRAVDPAESERRKKAREMFATSLVPGPPMSATKLAEAFGRGRQWGRDRIDEVRQGITDTGEFPIITDDMTREDAR
jgi:hypothetical protein